MAKVIYLLPDGGRLTADAEIGASLMQAAVTANVPGIVGECGGSQACATCHVYVDPFWFAVLPPLEAHEDALLDCAAAERRSVSRLSCQIEMSAALDGIVVEVPPAQ